MATFFGEVLGIKSRAVDYEDDDDDDGIVASCCVCRWSPDARREIDKHGFVKSNIVVIAIGPAATAFGRVYLMEPNMDILGAVCSGMKQRDTNTFSQRSPGDRTCYIYRLHSNPGVLLCQCNIQVSPEQAFSWAEQVLDKCVQKDTYVTILSSSTSGEYRSEVSPGDLETPFVRALKTEHFAGKPHCPYLESPNTVGGLPAQILSWCQVKETAALLVLCYTGTISVDADAVNSFKPVLNKSVLKNIIRDNERAAEMIQAIVDHYTDKDMLYI